MNKQLVTTVIICGLISIFTACKTSKVNQNYFSSDKRDSSHNRIWQSYDSKIQTGDKLLISVSALNPASAQIYSLAPNGSAGAVTVDATGNILYPQLGSIKAAGFTRNELRDIILSKLATYLKDPTVSVEFANFKVTVLGEVEKQGQILIADGKLTILEALGHSGDITEFGRRDSILIVREKDGVREFGHVNLLSNDVFKSPYFSLRQNDVIYVPMVKSKAYVSDKEQKPFNFTTISSILGIVTTVAFLIINIVR